ncbi:MAG: CHAT domain-containing protein, partial [Nitrospirae bacterium]|nr:CHAT domain-containing protein [Nitrospirota bacterium]
RAIGRPLKMQILADPRGDLKASYEEGVSIKDEIGKLDDWMNIFLMTTDIKTDSVKAKIRNFDIVHFAGHAEHSVLTPEESGWFLKDGKLNAKDIKNMTGGMPMPSLVFSNACQTGQTDEWRIGEDYEHGIFGLANAFLLSGVQHYIGTFWEIPDEAGSHFAIHFYRNLIRGVTIGEAMQLSRRALIEKYGEDTIVWASYVLYGDPTTKYINLDIEKKDTVETLIHGTNGAGKPTSSSPERTPPYKWVLISSVSLLLIGLVMFTFINQKNKLTTFEDRKQEQVLSDQKAADESRKRIDELVASLSAKYREGKFEQPKAVQDEWSTKPLTMVFMDIKSSEGGSDDSERLIAQLSRFIQAETKINMVEREILTKLLEELSLSSSALADPATSLKLGKLLSARIIITGSIIPEKKAQTIILRFIDTETTAVTKVISAESLSGEIDKDTIGKIGNQILDWVKTDFPLRGRILSVTGDKCQINLGQIHGIKTGNRLEILKEQAKGSDLYAVTGEVEIGEVGKDKSVASILNRTDVIKEGTKVRGKLLKIM